MLAPARQQQHTTALLLAVPGLLLFGGAYRAMEEPHIAHTHHAAGGAHGSMPMTFVRARVCAHVHVRACTACAPFRTSTHNQPVLAPRVRRPSPATPPCGLRGGRRTAGCRTPWQWRG